VRSTVKPHHRRSALGQRSPLVFEQAYAVQSVAAWNSNLSGSTEAGQVQVQLRGGKVIARSAQREVSSAVWLPKREPLLSPAGQALMASELGPDGPITIELRTGSRVLRRWESRLQNGWVAR
jgi:hypothetical protein